MSQTKGIIDKLLTNVSNKLTNQRYISEMIIPAIQVKQWSGKLGSYDNSHLRILNNIRMGGRGEAPRIEPSVRTNQGYQIEPHGLEMLLTKADFDNVEQPYDARQDATEELTELLWVGKERALAVALGDTSILTQNQTLSGTSQFSDRDNSNPLSVFITARLAVRDGCGMPPNLAIMDWGVAEHLRYHPQLLSSLGFKDDRPGGLGDNELAKALKVKRVLIGEAMFNSGKLGQSDSLSPIWDKNIQFAWVTERPGKKQKSLGYELRPTGRGPRQVFRSPVANPPQSESVIVVDDYDQLLSDVLCAYLIKNAVA